MKDKKATPITPGYRYRDPFITHVVMCVLRVNRKTRKALVISENYQRPIGGLKVVTLAYVRKGKRLAPDAMWALRIPCVCCGKARQHTVKDAAKMARKMGVKP